MELDFEIDKITESIEFVKTGESFETIVLSVEKDDLKQVSKKNGWNFNWKQEFSQKDRQVYKLVTKKEPNIIQGLLSLQNRESDKFIFMHLIENAPFNIGEKKLYAGVCGNLVAYAGKLSVESGFDGYLSYEAKTALIEHYKKTLGAVHIGGNKMVITKDSAYKLIKKYFPKKEEV